jgi:hypothetical protein
MPNWNMNNMMVKGEPKLVLQFIDENFLTQKVQKEPVEYIYILDFEKFLPTPLDEKGEIIDDWYNWRCRNWGTKWSAAAWQINYLDIIGDGMEDVEINNQQEDSFNEETIVRLSKELPEEYTEAVLQCSFDTAWCPPMGMFYLWKEKYQPLGLDLSIKYYEPGCCFAGEMKFSKEEELDLTFGDDELVYIAYLLEEGWESLDFYVDEILYMLEDMNRDKGEEFISKLQDLVEQKINEAPTNLDRATLIVDIFNNYRNYEPEKKEE